MGSTQSYVHAANKFQDALVEDLNGQLGRANRPPAWARKVYANVADLSARTIYACVRPRLVTDDKPAPSALGVAEELGHDLVPGIDADEAVQIGFPLLDAAARIGLIESVRPERTVKGGKRHDVTRVVLTATAELAMQSFRKFVPPLPAKPSKGVTINRNYRGLEPLPAPPDNVVHAVDRVQGTPWRVNERMLKLLVSDLKPSQFRQLASPNEPLPRVHKRNQLYAIGEAINHMEQGNEPFYLPCYLDFRGRVYQRGGTLQWTSGAKKIGRVLLEFADAPAVTDYDFRWLSYYAASLYGATNVPVGYGADWLNANRKLLDCWKDASRPEWRKAKKPLPFLRALGAIIEAEETASCRMPITLDASCSGLQHLALLSRDIDVAKYVNLVRTNAQDFYSTVAELAGESERDGTKKVLVPWLYGSGIDSGAGQLGRYERCKDCGAEPCSAHRARAARIHQTAEKLAPVSWSVFEWLQAAVGAFNKARRPIHWTTPSGLQLVQDYRHADKHPVPCYVPGENGSRRVVLIRRVATDHLHVRDQATGFAPNYVHSLDASLLVEVVNRPEVAHVERWAVAHDAFGVPVGAVDALRRACREALIAIYTPDVLERLRAEFTAQGVSVPPLDHPAALPADMLPKVYDAWAAFDDDTSAVGV